MARVNELIEWNSCGSSYSLYIRHFHNDEDKIGVKMIFEDVTRDKVTEIVIPARKMAAFLNAVYPGRHNSPSII